VFGEVPRISLVRREIAPVPSAEATVHYGTEYPVLGR
jgi:hypothetical protein